MATDYTQLITPQYRGQPKFAALLTEVTKDLAALQELLLGYWQLFDVDTAVGQQLDVVGLWVGVSRRVQVPISGSFFSFNTAGLGFNQAIWFGPYTPTTGLVELDDETYRGLIRAYILADHWDGSLRQYHQILQAAFPDNVIYAVDNLDMTLTIHVTGPTLSPIMSALLQTGALSVLRPAGVSIAGYVLPP